MNEVGFKCQANHREHAPANRKGVISEEKYRQQKDEDHW